MFGAVKGACHIDAGHVVDRTLMALQARGVACRCWALAIVAAGVRWGACVY